MLNRANFTSDGAGMTEVFLCDMVRTPRGRGRPGGALASLSPVRLLATVLGELQAQSGFSPAQLDDIVLGCVSPVGEQGGPLGRTAALLNGWDTAGPGIQVNRFCASGLDAMNLAAQKIRSGWESLVVAGGIEMMSRLPMFSDGGPWQFDPSVAADTAYLPQGISADLIATLGGFDRGALDAFAARSHQLAAVATAAGSFAPSMMPVHDEFGSLLLDRDENARAETSVESLAPLRPVFSETGKAGFDQVALRRYPQVLQIAHEHTAGNSSAIVDGVGLVLLASGAALDRQGLTPRARVLSVATVASEPVAMLTGPEPAARKALALAGLSFDQIDLFEVNEAFAAIPLHFMAQTGVPLEKLNIWGGAIAMGHPLGATGAMLAMTLVDQLHATGGRYGLVTLCIGAGMGSAMIVERV